MAGRVTHLFISPAAGAPMQACDEVTALAGVGLDGDRYAAGIGYYSGGPAPGRHLTLIDQAAIDAANAGLAVPLAPAETRRNIVTTGIDLETLLRRRFRIGGVECTGIRWCPPCTYLDGLLGRRVYDALTNRGGLRADIVGHGPIRIGDPITPIDDGSVG
jgi:MOSC domain-containing protein YiiM